MYTPSYAVLDISAPCNQSGVEEGGHQPRTASSRPVPFRYGSLWFGAAATIPRIRCRALLQPLSTPPEPCKGEAAAEVPRPVCCLGVLNQTIPKPPRKYMLLLFMSSSVHQLYKDLASLMAIS
jgi:hypothetical protein